MKMLIEPSLDSRFTYEAVGNVGAGEIFRFNDRFFVRQRSQVSFNETAVDISTGDVVGFSPSTQVEMIHTKLTWGHIRRG